MIRINGKTFGNELFPNKESIFRIIESEHQEFKILMQFEGNEDITNMIFAVKYIRDNFPNPKIELILQTIPYGQMDRQIDKQMFSLKYFASIINDMKFDKVYTLDPHSAISEELINNLVNCYKDKIRPLVMESIHKCGADFIHYPDKGSQDKYIKMFDMPYTTGRKTRDTKEKGNITNMEIELTNIESIKGKNGIIIDDICVRGGTFVLAAEKLIEAGAKDVYLFVTHCGDAIFSGDILAGDVIKKVYTTNSITRHGLDFRNKIETYTVWGR